MILLVIVTAAACVLACAGATPVPLSEDAWDRRIAESRELRLWIATAGAAVLTAGAVLRRTGRAIAFARARDVLLAALALATLAAWWHPHQGRFRTWHHVTDSFHYYLGSKYFDELGYTRLYVCAIVASTEAGLAPQMAGRQIRDLETNLPIGADVALQDPERCKRHFTPERWRSFSEDVRWYRSQMGASYWLGLLGDHGYNPPPTWTLVGALLTHTGPASRQQLAVLTWIDPLLLAGMFAALAFSFGWQVACIALIYWGTNQPASWEWVGGSILRYDWLAAMIAGLCCLKRERPASAGLLLAWAVGVRIFPIVVVAGLALGALLRVIRVRSLALTRMERRFAAGFAGGLAGILALTSACFGLASWSAFAENSRVDVATYGLTRLGLGAVLSYRHETRAEAVVDASSWDPYARWRAEREATLAARRPLLAASIAAYLALLVLATWRRDDWVAGVLAIGLVPVLLELSCYYFGLLLAYACLWQRREEVGIGLLLLSSATWWAGVWRPSDDFIPIFESSCILAFVAFATVCMIRATPGEARATR